jgi:hypothetical protein
LDADKIHASDDCILNGVAMVESGDVRYTLKSLYTNIYVRRTMKIGTAGVSSGRRLRREGLPWCMHVAVKANKNAIGTFAPAAVDCAH